MTDARGSTQVDDSPDKTESWWQLMVSVATITAVFRFVEPFFYHLGHLGARFYEGNFIVLRAVTVSWVVAAALLSATAFGIWQYRMRWSDLGSLGRHLRNPATAVAVCLSWFLTTVEYNFWWGSSFVPDRVLILVLLLLAVARPSFLGLFLVVAYVVTGQFNSPLNFSWTDKLAIYHLGLVIFIFFILRRIAGHRISDSAPFIVLCAVLGQWYLVPGIGKLQINWLGENNLDDLLVSAWHQNGWLSQLPSGFFIELAAITNFVNPVLLAAGLLIELSVLLFLSTRRITLFVLALCTLLHIAIAAASGIFFWKWVIFDLALLFCVKQIPPHPAARLFGWRPWLLMLIAMCSLAWTSTRVVKLAWYDEPFAYRFRFEVVGSSGDRYETIARHFAPYDLPFAQARFYFLTDRRQLLDTFGTTQDADVHAFFSQSYPERAQGIEQAIESLGTVRTNRHKAAVMSEFLARFMRNANREVGSRNDVLDIFEIVRAPNHIQTSQRSDSALPYFRHQERIKHMDVFLVERLLDGATGHRTFEEKILTVVCTGQ